jgi:hypothetical protein
MTVNLGGRPAVYNQEIANEICNAITTSVRSLESLCNSHAHWPCFRTVYSWINQDTNGFLQQYTRAKEQQADYLCDSILGMVDKPETFIDEYGNERNDVAMLRLKVDSLKWQAGKLRPRKWGDKQSLEISTVPHEDQLLALDHDNNG